MKIATIISRIFDPFIMFGASVCLLFWHSESLFLAISLYLFLPLVLFILAWKTKTVSNWDVTDRKERPKLLWSIFVIEAIGTLFFQLTPIIPYLFLFLGFILVTHVWKISGHTFACALCTGLVVKKIGLSWWPVLSIPFVVGWSRVYRKNHTFSQAIAGILYAWLFLAFSHL